MARITVRPARLEELPALDAAIAESEEQGNLLASIVFVAEHEGQVTHFAAARLVWVLEPLKELPGRPELPRHALRRATAMLAGAVEGWIADRARNTTGAHTYFAHVAGRRMQLLCESWGLRTWYPRARWFVKNV